MGNNLFISYDLSAPAKSYERTIAAIKSLGLWAHIQSSVWYVKSGCSAAKAAEIVRAAMDPDDTLLVIDASNRDACWYNLSPDLSQLIKDEWHKPLAA